MDCDPVTAPATPRPHVAAAPSTCVPSTPVVTRRPGTPIPGTPSCISAREKTGEETRSRSPQPRGHAAILHEGLELRPSTDPVEELATALLNDNVFTSDACALLLQLYTKYQHGVYKRPLFGKDGHGVVAATLGVYRHGGVVGVSGETWSRPCMTRYLNAFLHARCTASGYDAPLWASVQITNQGAGAHKDTSE